MITAPLLLHWVVKRTAFNRLAIHLAQHPACRMVRSPESTSLGPHPPCARRLQLPPCDTTGMGETGAPTWVHERPVQCGPIQAYPAYRKVFGLQVDAEQQRSGSGNQSQDPQLWHRWPGVSKQAETHRLSRHHGDAMDSGTPLVGLASLSHCLPGKLSGTQQVSYCLWALV